MSKAIEENKKKVTVKILALEHNLYWKFMCTDKNYDKNKTYKTYPLPPSTPVTVFLIAKNSFVYDFEFFMLSVCFYLRLVKD